MFGSELVVNGDFANSTTGWATAGETTVISVVDGRLKAVRDGTGTWGAPYTMFETTSGKVYEVTITIEADASNSNALYFRCSSSNSPTSPSIHDTSKFSHTIPAGKTLTTTKRFIATDNYSYIHVMGNANDTWYLDNVSVKEITNAVEYKNIPQSARELYSLEDDTWVGSNELVVNGDFATDLSSWVAPDGGWSWDNGKALLASTGNFQPLYQTTGIDVGKVYDFSFDVESNNLIAITPYADFSNTLGEGLTGSVSGRFTSVSTGISFKRTTQGQLITGTIDNVSVKQVIEVAS